MDQGRMAVCFDPNGAEFDVWEPKKHQGTDVDASVHGAPVWFDIDDRRRSRIGVLYRTVWLDAGDHHADAGRAVHDLKARQQYVAGMMPLTPQMGTRSRIGGRISPCATPTRPRGKRSSSRQALRTAAGHPGRRPLRRRHVTTGRHVLRYQLPAPTPRTQADF